MAVEKEKVTIGLEKIFFNWVLENPSQFERVEPYYFQNDDIQFIYTVIREEFLRDKNHEVPSPQQILQMVKLSDKDDRITNDIVKMLLKTDMSKYEEDWLRPKFQAWKVSNQIKNNLMKAIDYVRSIEDLNYDNVTDVLGKTKQMFNEIEYLEGSDDLGADFDDFEAHQITSLTKKLATGWATLDNTMGGGWDHASLNLIMGETNIGKSMWLQNISAKLADQGYNVAYITLEMAEQKVIKRLGSMRLKINSKDYDEKVKDTMFIKDRINKLLMSHNGLFQNKVGKIFIKKYDTGTLTITELDNYITKLKQVKKIEIHAVMVDYLNLMTVEKGNETLKSNLYLKGKHIAEGLRYIGDKHNLAVITATQVDKSVWGASDIDLNSVPESKAVAETADTFWAIIRNSEMKRNNLYKLKHLKQRDGECKGDQIRFSFDPNFLLMENDTLIGAA